jgi:hypothetical protein
MVTRSFRPEVMKESTFVNLGGVIRERFEAVVREARS